MIIIIIERSEVQSLGLIFDQVAMSHDDWERISLKSSNIYIVPRFVMLWNCLTSAVTLKSKSITPLF